MGLSMVQKDVAQMGVETPVKTTTTLTCQDLVDLVLAFPACHRLLSKVVEKLCKKLLKLSSLHAT